MINNFTPGPGGDILDVSDVFADAGVTPNSGNIGAYLTLQFDGTNTKVFIDLDAGSGTYSPVQVATLQGNVSLATLLGNSLDYTP